MLYLIGPVVVDTFPFSIDRATRRADADFAVKDLLGRLKGREFVGEGDEQLSVRGQILPHNPHLDGTPWLSVLHLLRKRGIPQFVIRGDGLVMGWFVITQIRELHTMLDQNGVGRVIEHEVELIKVISIPDIFDLGVMLIDALVTLLGTSGGSLPNNVDPGIVNGGANVG